MTLDSVQVSQAHAALMRDHRVDSQRVSFTMRRDPAALSIARLPLDHPAVIALLAWHTTVAVGVGLRDPRMLEDAALVSMRWARAGPLSAEAWPRRGATEYTRTGPVRIVLSSVFEDAAGQPLLMLEQTVAVIEGLRRGRGVERASRRHPPEAFGFVEPAIAGVSTAAECFIGPVVETAGASRCAALVDPVCGFIPHHPWQRGSGDHVNGNQIADICLQVAHAIGLHRGWRAAGQALRCVAGEMRFMHFIELGIPMDLVVQSIDRTGERFVISSTLSQAGRQCAWAQLELRPAPSTTP